MENKTFSVLETIKGVSYPTDDVNIYIDGEAAHEFWKIVERDNEEETPRLIELQERLNSSALTFYGRGFPPEVRQAIDDEATAKIPDEESIENFILRRNQYIATAITKVVNTAGEEDTHRWTADEVKDFAGKIPDESFAKLWKMVADLLFESLKFDEAVTADFS